MLMTVDETIKKWGIAEKTMLKYLSKGYIDGLILNNNVIYIPDIPLPLYIQDNVKLTCEKIYFYILKALNKQNYISSNMLNITGEQFELFLSALEKGEYIMVKSKNEPKSSILRYIITPKGVKEIKPGKNTINIKKLNLIPININFNGVKIL